VTGAGAAPNLAPAPSDDEWNGLAAVPAGGAALYLELDGWEGPLDLLLDLARRQKVDLKRISILALVDQYLIFIGRAEEMRLELAADYLVMAAWLAYLKSALLLPKEEQEEPGPEELALRLQLRLQRLGAMREAAARLLARDRVGRDVFVRGAPEGLRTDRRNRWQCDWFALVQAYGQVKARTAPVVHMVRERPVMTLDTALERVSAMLGVTLRWLELRDFLPPDGDPRLRRSALASSFGAGGIAAGQQFRPAACAAAGPVSDAADEGPDTPDVIARAVEAALFAAEEPLTAEAISAHLGGADVRAALRELADHYSGRGICLVERGRRWQFQTAPDLAHLLRREQEESRRLSRAATEVLAIIAYHEPVSRAQIESIRGVQTARGTLDVLMEAGWVRPAGRREVPGRPVVYATTPEFLVHFGLNSRRDLPGIDELRAAGLLDPVDDALEALMSGDAAGDGPAGSGVLDKPDETG
jgi:segregation and condensation protein A